MSHGRPQPNQAELEVEVRRMLTGSIETGNNTIRFKKIRSGQYIGNKW
jgi:hypothetical protein